MALTVDDTGKTAAQLANKPAADKPAPDKPAQKALDLFKKAEAVPAEKAKAAPKDDPKDGKGTTGATLVKDLKAAGLNGAAAEADKGIREIAEAKADDRNAAVVGYRVGKAAVKTAIAGVGDVAGKVADATKPIHEPFTRAIDEGKKEIGEAQANTDAVVRESAENLVNETREEWEEGDGMVEKVVGAGAEILENSIEGGIAWAGAELNERKEELEAIGDAFIHNPLYNAYREAGKGIVELGKGALAWGQDRIEGGARGAAKAQKTIDATQDRIEKADKALEAEQTREMDAATRAHDENEDRLREEFSREVSEEWEQGEDGLEKVLGATGEIVENGIGFVVSDLGAELHVANTWVNNEIEKFGSDLKHGGEQIAAAWNGAGEFFGGLFGG